MRRRNGQWEAETLTEAVWNLLRWIWHPRSIEELYGRPREPGARKKALDHYGHRCAVCGYSDVVEVHHRNGDRTNNDIRNLIVLCPNHHAIADRELRKKRKR
jgi:predicted restriction endonuclease